MNLLSSFFLRFSLLIFSLFLFFSCNRHNTEKTEKARVDSVLKVNSDSIFIAPQKVKENLQALQRSVSDSSNWYKAEVFIGTCSLFTSDSTSANECYRRTLSWCRRNPEASQVAGLLWNHLGVNHIAKGEVKQSQECYQRSFNYLNTPPKEKLLVSTTINLADTYFQQGNTPQAAFYYRYALFLCDSLHDVRSRTSVLCGLGQVYMELENFTEAHHFFSSAARSIGKEPIQTQFFYHFSLGNCFYYENRYAEAIQSFRRANALASELKSELWQFNSNANIAEIYLMEDSVRQAHVHLSFCQAMLAHRQLVLPPSHAFYFESLLSDLAIAEGREKNIRQYVYAPISPNVSTYQRYLMLHFRRLQRYAARMGKWEEAYYCMKRASAYADTLSNLQARNNVAEMGNRYQRDTTLLHQQIAISNYEMENARQEKYIIAAVALLTILVLAASLIIAVYRRKALKRLAKQTERITELRMSVVRNRVSPHYIFNVLGTIIPKLQHYPELVGPSEMLIDVLRGNLLSSSKAAVALSDEVALVRRYIDLYHYSKSPYPDVSWDIDEALLSSRDLIPSMSIQIPVENALKHAFPSLSPDCQIHISIQLKDNVIHLDVTDNGQGYNPGKTQRTGRDTGSGLLLINSTLRILNQYNSRAASFNIVNVPPPHHGTHAQLRIPVGYDFSTFA